jgi:hypothetical protein
MVGNRIPSVQRNVSGTVPAETGGPKTASSSSSDGARANVDAKDETKDQSHDETKAMVLDETTDETKGDMKDEVKDENSDEVKAETKEEAKSETISETKYETVSETISTTKDEGGDTTKTDSMEETKVESGDENKPDNNNAGEEDTKEDSKDNLRDDFSATPLAQSAVVSLPDANNLVPSTLPRADESTGTPLSTVTEPTATAPSLSLDSEDLRDLEDLQVSGITRTTSSLSINPPSAVHSSMYVESDSSSRQPMQDVSGVSTPTGTPKIVRKGLEDDPPASSSGGGSDDGEERRRDDETPGPEEKNIINLGADKLELKDPTVQLNASGDVEDLVQSKTTATDLG